jgi:hypothetical protein
MFFHIIFVKLSDHLNEVLFEMAMHYFEAEKYVAHPMRDSSFTLRAKSLRIRKFDRSRFPVIQKKVEKLKSSRWYSSC